MQGVLSAAARFAPQSVLIGRYRLLECIGEGGMGIVWRCFDLDLEESVAVKFLRDEFAQDDALRASFRREVKLARRVTHPNVARVYEFGRDDNIYFLTMEYIEGESLQTLLDRGPLAPSRVAALALGLCRGLAAAHAAGVIHGDIKPGNIMVGPRRGAVLTDFGVSRVLSEAHLPDSDWRGTPIYMAPEQLMSGVLTVQCDVYAIGVVLVEALTGQLPWPEMADMLQDKFSGHEPDLKALAPGLSPAWLGLIIDCLRTDRGLRPADARALLGRLAALCDAPPGASS